MAQERPLTPERQLLKLIEDPKAKKGANVETRAGKQRKRGIFSLGAWGSRLSFLTDRLKKWRGRPGSRQLNIKVINRLLVLSAFVLAGYLIYSLSRGFTDLTQSTLEYKAENDMKFSVTEAATSVLKRVSSYYLEKVQARNIFKMGEQKMPVVVETAPEEAPAAGLVGAFEHLKLVGISWSAKPDAMIEDTNSYKTFFVRTGQMIGKIKVEAIYRDKVILSFDGMEHELK